MPERQQDLTLFKKSYKISDVLTGQILQYHDLPKSRGASSTQDWFDLSNVEEPNYSDCCFICFPYTSISAIRASSSSISNCGVNSISLRTW